MEATQVDVQKLQASYRMAQLNMLEDLKMEIELMQNASSKAVSSPFNDGVLEGFNRVLCVLAARIYEEKATG